MLPVICFFENETYIYSTDYVLHLCPDSISATDFLNRIEKEFADEMKVVQVNFDAYNFELTKHQTRLYENNKASVFILKTFEILSLTEIALKQKVNTSSSAPFQLLVTKNEFLEKVIQIKEMIAAGRFYQVNLTYAFKALLKTNPFDFFLNHQANYTGNYKAFLPFANHSVISFSPELFLEKKGLTLKTEPIKGSISKNENSDTDLLKSAKEQAELSMIVDLLRNDLNSLETKSSAQVTKHRQVMNLNYIQHTYSEVTIQTEKNMPFILEKMMPGGSISGCPKKESLIAITELEPTARSIYTGAIGFWQKNDFKLNIAIRTFVQTEEAYYYFAGCGIVYDSNPEKEFEELINKAGRLNVQYK